MEQIFISYRRDDSADVAGRIYDGLKEHFGAERVFKDVDKIPFGVDFRHHLDGKVGECQAFLVIIGRQWISASNERGQRRLEDAADFVRVEIESALKRGIPVIPLLVHGTEMPPLQELPESIRDLAYRNGIPIRPDPDFHNDIRRLINGLEYQLGIPARDARGGAVSSHGDDGSAPSQVGGTSTGTGRLRRTRLLVGSLMIPLMFAGVWAITRWFLPESVPETPQVKDSAVDVAQAPQSTTRLPEETAQEVRNAQRVATQEVERQQALARERAALQRQAEEQLAADAKAKALQAAQAVAAQRALAAAQAVAQEQAAARAAEEELARDNARLEDQARLESQARLQAQAEARTTAAQEAQSALRARTQAQAKAKAEADQRAKNEQLVLARAKAKQEAQVKAQAQAAAVAAAQARQEVRIGIFPHETDRPCFHSVGPRMEDAAKQFEQSHAPASVDYSYYRPGRAPPGLGQDSTVWRGDAVHKEPAVAQVQAVARALRVNAVLMGWYQCSASSNVDDYQYVVEVFLVDVLSGRVYKERVGLYDTARVVEGLLQQMRRDRG